MSSSTLKQLFRKKLPPSTTTMSSSTLKQLHGKKRRKGNKLYILPVVVFTVLMLLVGTINYIQFNGNNPKNLIMANDLKSLINQSTSSSKSSPVALDGSILKECYAKLNASCGADSAWEDIILQGAEAMKENNFQKKLAAFEVGAHRATQSLAAAKQRFHTYTVEPSPGSFSKIAWTMNDEVKKDPSLGGYIHLFNAAAGSESGKTLDFKVTGGTGDHVGEFDVWNMKAGKDPKDFPKSKQGKIMQIPSMKLDDIIFGKVKPTEVKGLESGNNPPDIDEYWALKVDTQGFEPQVFAGLKESIKQQKFKYIMTEYWPNGIGLLNNSQENKCEVAVEMMSTIAAAGYKLYALPLVGHPKGMTGGVKNALKDWKARPLHDLAADCQFMLDIETKFPNPEYQMGYWTDYLAVAPGVDPVLVLPASSSS